MKISQSNKYQYVKLGDCSLFSLALILLDNVAELCVRSKLFGTEKSILIVYCEA